MLLAGLRRCEVLGLRFQDVQVADRGWPWWRARRASPGGPAANRFFDALGGYLHERPDTAGTDRVL
jgi:integrase